MYYDPMISKLITWGKDRKEALDLLEKAMDEYVIRGVVHNLGFGQSILRNPAFASGHYSTAFIPTYYPNGYRGDPLTSEDRDLLAIASHYIRNDTKKNTRFEGAPEKSSDDVLYASFKGGDKDHDYKIVKKDGVFEITDLADNKTSVINASNFDFDYGSLLRFDVNGERRLIQFEDSREEVNLHFAMKGS
jgi:acetyl/propionyl-CoA carboxylase alpha subunit